MFSRLFPRLAHIDWVLMGAALLIMAAGLVTMNSFVPSENYFFDKQLVWGGVALIVFLLASLGDYRFLRRRETIVILFLLSIALLAALFAGGEITKGAQSRFDVGLFDIQPADPVKLVLILLLAKYFSRRHVEIAHVRHIITSGAYAFILAALVFFQPDFGSAIIIALIWLGMVLLAGISLRHLAAVLLFSVVSLSLLWSFGFEDYQKQRILTFLHPLTDLHGAGYNAYQSTVAVGSGELWGKGIGYGTQSKLQFLPEYETDFIFAAFAEEWGFAGVILLFTLYGIIIVRILSIAMRGATNFEVLYGLGLALYFMSHIVIHVGINVGVLPVTGTTLPFMSYGGSHLVTEFLGLGILMGQRAYSRAVHKEDMKNEFLGM